MSSLVSRTFLKVTVFFCFLSVELLGVLEELADDEPFVAVAKEVAISWATVVLSATVVELDLDFRLFSSLGSAFSADSLVSPPPWLLVGRTGCS